ncbi:MAG: hypothetical protein HN764_05485 [Gammaproteobacteria bacterium]|jgi:hypothetical protein|nr:hypothetical protein [Gammaproteobacteria bacterium]
MRSSALIILGSILFINVTPAVSMEQTQTSIDVLRAELTAIRSDYESRIAALEQRLVATEQKLQQTDKAGAAAAEPTIAAAEIETVRKGNRSAVGENVFNPAIGVIFQGSAWDYRKGPANGVPGFPLGGEAGAIDEGLAIGETEIDISANVDDKFSAWLTLPVVIEDGESKIEIEEAWIETQALPAGLSARIGRMFSGIGYLNSKHAHSWDFADQPLAYQALLGDQYLDDGVQLRWLAPTDLYIELGGEIMRGGRYPAGGADDSGFGARTLFARSGGDIGDSSSWLAGISYLNAGSEGREMGDEDDPIAFNGNSNMLIAELVWKWAPRGNWKDKNFVFQSEYIWRKEKGHMLLPDGRDLAFDAAQQGWYAQAVYQPVPRWRVGARFDLLSADNPGLAFAGTELDPMGKTPKRFSLMADWSNSEFSRLRFQYTRDESGLVSDDQWGVQYIFSIGAHGAHSF